MTLDDVVVRTAAMLAVLLTAGAISWSLTSNTAVAGGLLFVSLDGRRRSRPVHGLHHAGQRSQRPDLLSVEGFLLGAISRIFEERWPGIVVQAVTGTVMVAAGMLIVYKTGWRSGHAHVHPGLGRSHDRCLRADAVQPGADLFTGWHRTA